MDEHKKGRFPHVCRHQGNGQKHHQPKGKVYAAHGSTHAHGIASNHARYKTCKQAYTKAHQHSGIVWPQMPLQGTWGGYDGR